MSIQKKLLPFCIATFTVVLFGCASVQSKIGKLPPLNGMVFDSDNKPVTDAILSIDGNDVAITDIQGHFSISPIQTATPLTVVARKKAYEPSSIEFFYSDPGQILYIKMISAEQLIEKAEGYIAARNWEDATVCLRRAQAIDGNPSVIQYLNAVILSGKGRYQEAESELIALAESDAKSPFVFLFLADLYEYKLSDGQKAILYLEKFLAYRSDEEIEARLSKLRQGIGDTQ